MYLLSLFLSILAISATYPPCRTSDEDVVPCGHQGTNGMWCNNIPLPQEWCVVTFCAVQVHCGCDYDGYLYKCPILPGYNLSSLLIDNLILS